MHPTKMSVAALGLSSALIWAAHARSAEVSSGYFRLQLAKGATYRNVFSRAFSIRGPGFEEIVHRESGAATYTVIDTDPDQPVFSAPSMPRSAHSHSSMRCRRAESNLPHGGSSSGLRRVRGALDDSLGASGSRGHRGACSSPMNAAEPLISGFMRRSLAASRISSSLASIRSRSRAMSRRSKRSALSFVMFAPLEPFSQERSPHPLACRIVVGLRHVIPRPDLLG